MAEEERHFDVVGVVLVLLGLAYAGFAIYWGSNVAWAPHTDYYIQQIVGTTGKYVVMAPVDEDWWAVIRTDGGYLLADISSDGLVRSAYRLPDMNYAGAAIRDGKLYFASTSGKTILLYVFDGSKVVEYRYVLDLWSVTPVIQQSPEESPVFYFGGQWRNHRGILRVDFSDLNNPVARVFYDVPAGPIARWNDIVYFSGANGFLRELFVHDRVGTEYRVTIRATPLGAVEGNVLISTPSGAGIVRMKDTSADAFVLNHGGADCSAVFTDFGTFVSCPDGLFVMGGADQNSLRVFHSTTPFSVVGYVSGPAKYAIYGAYAGDPGYIYGTFDFPQCPNNFAPLDANVTYIVAPREEIQEIHGVLTPIELNGIRQLTLDRVELHSDFPCYSQ